jgi:hypothetical protein
MSEAEDNKDAGAHSGADMASELAYVRSLAEEGRNTPLVGGRFYLLWGVVIGAAAFVSWLDSIGVIVLNATLELTMWVGAFVLGWALTLLIGARSGPRPGATSMGNKTASSVWFAVGIFMTVFWGGLLIVHDDFTRFGVPPYFLFNLLFPVAFGLYGVAFFATATAARVSWLKGVALAAFGFSFLSLLFMTSPHQSLIGLIGLIVCAIAPGIVLMRREPSEII